jgi:hypothetical protein
MTTTPRSVFVFNASKASFPGGVFTTREVATQWIAEHKLSGTLTEYPLDIGVYDWAVQGDLFTPKRPDHQTPNFIGSFSSASQWHEHYENGG